VFFSSLSLLFTLVGLLFAAAVVASSCGLQAAFSKALHASVQLLLGCYSALAILSMWMLQLHASGGALGEGASSLDGNSRPPPEAASIALAVLLVLLALLLYTVRIAVRHGVELQEKEHPLRSSCGCLFTSYVAGSEGFGAVLMLRKLLSAAAAVWLGHIPTAQLLVATSVELSLFGALSAQRPYKHRSMQLGATAVCLTRAAMLCSLCTLYFSKPTASEGHRVGVKWLTAGLYATVVAGFLISSIGKLSRAYASRGAGRAPKYVYYATYRQPAVYGSFSNLCCSSRSYLAARRYKITKHRGDTFAAVANPVRRYSLSAQSPLRHLCSSVDPSVNQAFGASKAERHVREERRYKQRSRAYYLRIPPSACVSVPEVISAAHPAVISCVRSAVSPRMLTDGRAPRTAIRGRALWSAQLRYFSFMRLLLLCPLCCAAPVNSWSEPCC